MPTVIYWNGREDNADMIVYHNDGTETVIPFDEALTWAVPAIAKHMGESQRSVLHRFASNQSLQINDDSLVLR